MSLSKLKSKDKQKLQHVASSSSSSLSLVPVATNIEGDLLHSILYNNGRSKKPRGWNVSPHLPIFRAHELEQSKNKDKKKKNKAPVINKVPAAVFESLKKKDSKWRNWFEGGEDKLKDFNQALSSGNALPTPEVTRVDPSYYEDLYGPKNRGKHPFGWHKLLQSEQPCIVKKKSSQKNKTSSDSSSSSEDLEEDYSSYDLDSEDETFLQETRTNNYFFNLSDDQFESVISWILETSLTRRHLILNRFRDEGKSSEVLKPVSEQEMTLITTYFLQKSNKKMDHNQHDLRKNLMPSWQPQVQIGLTTESPYQAFGFQEPKKKPRKSLRTEKTKRTSSSSSITNIKNLENKVMEIEEKLFLPETLKENNCQKVQLKKNKKNRNSSGQFKINNKDNETETDDDETSSNKPDPPLTPPLKPLRINLLNTGKLIKKNDNHPDDNDNPDERE